MEKEIEIKDKNEVSETSFINTDYKFIKDVAVSTGLGTVSTVVSNIILKRFFKRK